MLDAIKEYSGVDLRGLDDEQARLAAKEKGLDVEPNATFSQVLDEFRCFRGAEVSSAHLHYGSPCGSESFGQAQEGRSKLDRSL